MDKMPQENIDWNIQHLFDTVRILSLPFEEQIKLFPKWAAIADELSFDLESSLYVAEINQEQFGLNDSIIDSCKKILNILSEMTASKNPTLWTLDALENNEEWKIVREEARKTLEIINENS